MAKAIPPKERDEAEVSPEERAMLDKFAEMAEELNALSRSMEAEIEASDPEGWAEMKAMIGEGATPLRAGKPGAQGPEVRMTMPDLYSVELFHAVCAKHGIDAYRYSGQRYTTVMVDGTEKMIRDVVYPEFMALWREMDEAMYDITDRLVKRVRGAAPTRQ